MKLLICTIILAFALLVAMPIFATNYTYNSASGIWNNADNWLPVGVPGAGDDVTINVGTVILQSDVSVNNFTLNGGIVQGLSAINLGGDLIWHKGDFNNEGAITVAGSFISVNSSPGSSTFNLNRRYGGLILNGGGMLENPKMAFLNGADLQVISGTTLTIDATSLANFTSINVNSTGSTLDFQGDIVKNGPKGFTLTNSNFTLSNQISINQGSFGIGGNSSNIINMNGCTVNMTSGTTFRMNPGTLNLNNTTFLGAGTFDVAVGIVNINAGNSFPSSTIFNITMSSNGTVNVNQNISIRTISVNSGTLAVCSNKNLTISFNLSNAGTIKGIGSITIAPGAIFSNTGTVASGCSTGTLTFIGNYTNNVLDYEIEESSGIPSTDLLNVTGNITLGGTLNIQYLNGSIPPGTYDIITCTGTRTGIFATVNYPTNCTGNCSVIYTSSKAQLVLNAVLPLELLGFSASIQNDDVLLVWRTANETRVRDFGIERSTNGITWEHTGFQTANNLKTEDKYFFTDFGVTQVVKNSEKLYYRLKMNDLDGKFEYSPTTYIGLKSQSTFRAWPNPVTANVILHYNSASETEQVLQVYGSDGRLVLSQPIPLQKGENEWPLSTVNWPSGLYQIALGTLTLELVKS